MRAPIACVLLLAGMGALPAEAENADSASPTAALAAGKPILNLRPRYEYVDQAGVSTGEALTLRTLAGWQTGRWAGLSGTLELIDVGRFEDEYNDTLNGKTRYPVIADPDNTDVNQLYLDYTGLADTRIRAGRQSIKLDNVRFVGNVEFRQVMQVFNGVTVENNSLRDTRLFAGYLGRVKTINTRQHDTDTVLLNVRHALGPDHALVAFGYFQDQHDAIAPGAFLGALPRDTSNRILGLRADGSPPLGADWRLLYTLEYAQQADYADGDARIDADYLRVGAGAKWRDYSVRIDREQLSSNEGLYAFQTPLGTNHLFQGWADQFLVTPRQGLRDTFVSAAARFGQAQVLAEYHDLASDVGNLDFGSEFDLGLSYPLARKLTGKLEYADYRAGDAATAKVDVTKVWVTLIFNY